MGRDFEIAFFCGPTVTLKHQAWWKLFRGSYDKIKERDDDVSLWLPPAFHHRPIARGVTALNTCSTIHEVLNPLVPSKPHYGHCNFWNANNRKSVKNWSSNFEVQICGFTINIFQKNIFFNSELYNYQNTYEQKAKILQIILENTVNTHKYNTCAMLYFLCLEVFF